MLPWGEPSMSASSLAKIAIALMLVALSGESASACFWRCREYPPMYAPAYNPKRGPIWTPNGWAYPPAWSRVPPFEYVMEEEYLAAAGAYAPPPARYVEERGARWRGYDPRRELGPPLK